jgi:hypothetical protein
MTIIVSEYLAAIMDLSTGIFCIVCRKPFEIVGGMGRNAPTVQLEQPVTHQMLVAVESVNKKLYIYI